MPDILFCHIWKNVYIYVKKFLAIRRSVEKENISEYTLNSKNCGKAVRNGMYNKK